MYSFRVFPDDETIDTWSYEIVDSKTGEVRGRIHGIYGKERCERIAAAAAADSHDAHSRIAAKMFCEQFFLLEDRAMK